jgi:HEAT repeat protein
MTTGFAKDFLPRIIEIAEEDDELPVRLAAISALSTILTKEALEALRNLMHDRVTDVRDAVAIAVKDWAAAYRAMATPPANSP